MSLTEYQLFCAIAEQKNMKRAAEQLHITPSAATHAMNALEKSLGFPLLNRDRGGITLTVQGELLLPHFRAVLQEEEKLQEEISQIHGLEKGCVRLGTLNSICTDWLPSILNAFSKKYPNIEVRVYQGGYQEIEERLLDSRLDIGFVSLPTSESFNTITLLHDRLYCIAPLDFTPKHSTYVTAEDLKAVSLIQAQRGYDRNIQGIISENQLVLDQRHSIALESAAIALVEGGMGCSIVPEMVLRRHPGKYRIYPLLNSKDRTIALALLKGKKVSLACDRMVQEIREQIERTSTE